MRTPSLARALLPLTEQVLGRAGIHPGSAEAVSSVPTTLPNLPQALGVCPATNTFNSLRFPIIPPALGSGILGAPAAHVGGSRPLLLRPDLGSFQAPFDNDPPLPTIPSSSGLWGSRLQAKNKKKRSFSDNHYLI